MANFSWLHLTDLNWRSDVDRPLDSEEALPQLEYVAFEMCRRGVQQLRRDELLELLEGVRRAYPHIRPVGRHDPEEFVALLEARTGILVQVGEVRHSGQLVPVYEFRHLTFQEYLAGLALVEGRFPGHEKERSLAERVAPLVGQTAPTPDSRMRYSEEPELEVSESWREPLRLFVSCCNDDDVDDALQAILEPAEDEDPEQTARPRAILAALCLADEPNVSREVAELVLVRFAKQIRPGDGTGQVTTGADRAAMELAASEWCKALAGALAREFIRRDPKTRSEPGSLHDYAKTREGAASALGSIKDPRSVEPLINKLNDEDASVRQAAVGALGAIRDDEIDTKLLSLFLDAKDLWLDPRDTISKDRIKEAAEALKLSAKEVRRRYEALADAFGLPLAWKSHSS